MSNAYLAPIAAFENMQKPIALSGSAWCPGGLEHTNDRFFFSFMTKSIECNKPETAYSAAFNVFSEKKVSSSNWIKPFTGLRL